MTAAVVIAFAVLILGTGIALVRMNRLTCEPCNTADDSAYCNPPRPHRPT